MKPKLAICGAAGRMGGRILALSKDGSFFNIIAAIERKDHPEIGKEAAAGVKLTNKWPAAADVVIDFSTPAAADATIEYCRKNGAALVLGTTGLVAEQMEKLKAACEKIPAVYATNMSVGMNVLFATSGKLAAMLGEQYDIEIIEQHHRFKKDAPSGSALTLAEKICSATGRDSANCITYGRSGREALRRKGEICIHAVRAGDITGIHSVIFGTLGETVMLNHTAHSRDTFAQGALRAGQWVIGKKAGLYSMTDVLGLK
jgi:4-hydroxy-tetrahydrodipicolinate reductase